MKSISILKPDDWHLHLREGQILEAVLPATVNSFRRAIVMPNLIPPVTNVEMAMTYRQDILNACPVDSVFEPLMTLYLTDHTLPADVQAAAENPFIHAFKLYPASATTNSASGVTSLPDLMPALEAMVEYQIPMLVHGEVTDPAVDVFDREAVFIEHVMSPLLDALPGLKVVFEHLTTRQGVEFVLDAGDNVVATLTAHHLLLNRNAMFNKGICPHHYCLPVLKREEHRQALLAAAISGNHKFFLGTDSAPHDRALKESSCGCAGIFSSPVALELYAQIFESSAAMDKLEGFASLYGPEFYGLPVNKERVTLQKEDWQVPSIVKAGTEEIIPLCAGEILRWRLGTDLAEPEKDTGYG
ncbi:MAG: dihydroorotase [bacterium]|nr:MAG: dihydroorotase [bacterium]